MYHRWLWLIKRKKHFSFKEIKIDAIEPNGDYEAKLSITPLKRGLYPLNSISVFYTDPLGVYKKEVEVKEKDRILVLPKIYEVERIILSGKRKFQSGGVALSHSVANSDEFIALRDYRQGDPLNKIHWKSWAKAGKPIVKEYVDEFFTRHGLILDTFPSLKE